MAGHDSESPSSLQQKMLCPGSGAAQRGLPDTYSTSSLKGTAAHQILEQALQGSDHLLGCDDLSVDVATPDADESSKVVRLDGDDLSAIRKAYDYVQSKCLLLTEVFSELKVDPEKYIGTSESKGTADIILINYISATVADVEVCDFKNGHILVEIEDHIQTITYGLGVLSRLDAEGIDVRNMTLTILQPNVDHIDGTIRSVTLTRDELLSYVPVIKNIILGSRDRKAKRVPGEEQCHFCRAKAKCPAIMDQAMLAVRTVFKPLATLTSDDIGDSLTREPGCLTPEQRSMVLSNATLIRGWLDAVSKFTLSEDLKGRKTPGYKVVSGQSRQKYVSDEESTIRSLRNLQKLDKLRLTYSDITSTKILTPNQLTNRLKPQLSKKTWKYVEKLINKPPGGPKLVPVTHAGDPVRKEVTDVFEPLRKAVLDIFEPIEPKDTKNDLSFLD